MKYLLFLALVINLAYSQSEFSTIEDVNRKINLEQKSYVDIISEIKFKPLKGTKYYYHVVPKEYGYNVVEIRALKMTNFDELKVERLA